MAVENRNSKCQQFAKNLPGRASFNISGGRQVQHFRNLTAGLVIKSVLVLVGICFYSGCSTFKIPNPVLPSPVKNHFGDMDAAPKIAQASDSAQDEEVGWNEENTSAAPRENSLVPEKSNQATNPLQFETLPAAQAATTTLPDGSLIQPDQPDPGTRPNIESRSSIRINPIASPAIQEPEPYMVPFEYGPTYPGVVESSHQGVSISAKEASLHDVLTLISKQQGISIVAPHDLNMNVTLTLQPTTLENALAALMAVTGCVYTRINDVIYVTAVQKETHENFAVQGRMVWVFDLNYIAAEDAEKVIRGLLSPVGQVFFRQVDVKDKRRAVEQIVVEDLPPFIKRIEGYLMHADQPPRQVIVEARVLQIKLNQEDRHGINLEHMANISGAEVIVGTQMLATGTIPGAVFTVEGNRFKNLIDCLVTTTDSKTLAAPRLLMINGQESRIQIGRRIGFSTSTTTQTVTVENVQFLDVGVLLNVTPQITADGNILMRINPKVSTGEISPVNNLPQEETTELETSVMVADGDGVIIGGLIQESDVKRQSKLPFLGDLWLVGRLFQRNTVARERSEVIVALLPRIVNTPGSCTSAEYNELTRATTPIMTPELKSARRPEPSLPDAVDNPVWPRRARSRR